MQERRRYKREVLIKYLHVFDRDSGKVLGFLGDISAHGLMLISEEKLAVDQEYALGIRLHKWEADLHYVNSAEQAHLSCRAELRWSRPLDEYLWANGFMISDLPPYTEQSIEDLIHSIGKNELAPQATHAFLDALFCLDNIPEPSRAEELGNGLVKQAGVVSVTFETDTPHLLVVQYHRERTAPQQIADYIQTQGMAVRLIP
jgi:hypothetical protein